ncbi:hypothetical protein OFN53_43025, partial [Escherichia coli]|nr:hypothetical protein [Escherichia coli]
CQTEKILYQLNGNTNKLRELPKDMCTKLIGKLINGQDWNLGMVKITCMIGIKYHEMDNPQPSPVGRY